MKPIIGLITVLIIGFLFSNELLEANSVEKAIEREIFNSVNRIVLGESEREVEKELNQRKKELSMTNVVITVEGKKEYGEEIVVLFEYDYTVNSWLRYLFNIDSNRVETKVNVFYNSTST